VLDTADAAAAALAAIDNGDLDRVAEIWHAAPHLGQQEFTSGYIAAILLATSEQPEDAREVIAAAAGQAGEATRLAGAKRLRLLARQLPAHAGILTSLAAVLEDPPREDGPAEAEGTDPPDGAVG
jgi:hypothetical protein